MKVAGFIIKPDGETVSIAKIGFNEKKKVETQTTVAYARDLQGALQSVWRKATVQALEKEDDAKKLVTLLERQFSELKTLVKKGCKECLEG